MDYYSNRQKALITIGLAIGAWAVLLVAVYVGYNAYKLFAPY